MQNKTFFYFSILIFIFILGSCKKIEPYAAEINDLNGTWLPNWSYKATLEIPENDIEYESWFFSWGEGKLIMHTTFEIDLAADIPFFNTGGYGTFYVTEILQTKTDSVKIYVFNGRPDKPDWITEFLFNFIDKDTIWIENKHFEERDRNYGKGALWHRISGPSR